MDNFLKWIEENIDIVIISLGILLITMFVVLVINLQKTSIVVKILTKKALKIKEQVTTIDNDTYDIALISNISYSAVKCIEAGIVYKKTHLPIVTEAIEVPARETLEIKDCKILVSIVRSTLIGEGKKIGKFYLYAKDYAGRISKVQSKVTRKLIKKQLKNEKTIMILNAKQQRKETGNYNTGERFVMVLGVIVSPIVNLFTLINSKLNVALKRRQTKKEVKNIKKQKEKEIKKEELKAEHDEKVKEAMEDLKAYQDQKPN